MIIGIIETFRVVIGRVGREFHRYQTKSAGANKNERAFVAVLYNIGCLWSLQLKSNNFITVKFQYPAGCWYLNENQLQHPHPPF